MDQFTLQNVAVERSAMVDGVARRMRILSDVNVAIPQGGKLALFGPSGAGKTSLLRLFNRLDDPTEGHVLLRGVDLRMLNPIEVRRRVGMVFQQPFLFDLTVMENLVYPLRLQNRELSETTARELLTELGLPAEFLSRRAQQLSGGQQQRVAIARALSLEPEALLLDEPSSALDDESADAMMRALLARNARGLTLVMITHSRRMLDQLACPSMIVRDGQAQLYADYRAAEREAADALDGGG